MASSNDDLAYLEGLDVHMAELGDSEAVRRYANGMLRRLRSLVTQRNELKADTEHEIRLIEDACDARTLPLERAITTLTEHLKHIGAALADLEPDPKRRTWELTYGTIKLTERQASMVLADKQAVIAWALDNAAELVTTETAHKVDTAAVKRRMHIVGETVIDHNGEPCPGFTVKPAHSDWTVSPITEGVF